METAPHAELGREDRPIAAGTDPRDTRDRLIEAISAHGPITAKDLAARFSITSAAVRRHLAALEAEGIIQEHAQPVGPRGRGRPSKSFVLAPAAHESLGSEYDQLARLAVEELMALGGDGAVHRLAERRVQPWIRDLAARIRAAQESGRTVDASARVQLLAQMLTEMGYATTARPVTVPLPAASGRPGGGTRTLRTAQLVQGHCPIKDIAAEHSELCEVETQAISQMLGVPVQRLATLAGGAHACTTHIPLTEGRTS
ncbi:helix-turn-helix transcriptional regulator [Brachybacterium hainanense]|uniref:Helix-turn-helix transcriptional regulator n=1 Tax=Brachybacterium hainanense TaxID=1541174 RepID=A0ABV6RF82_9MICO